MRRPSLLLFDLGGVLVDNQAFACLKQLLPPTFDDAAIRGRWLASSAVREFECGDIAAEEFAERFIAEWSLPLDADQFIAEFAAWPRGLYPGAGELLRALRAKYRLGCLSNCNPVHWARFAGFLGEFDLAFSSHLLGVVKPDAACFARALAACGADPAEVGFFDDSPANVETARNLGMRAFHADGFEELKRIFDTQEWLT